MSSILPRPLFDTYKTFSVQSAIELEEERPCIVEFLKQFEPELPALRDYRYVRSFLKSYSKNESTFRPYRTRIEQLFLWSLIHAKKSILDLKRTEAEAFVAFCKKPDPKWIGRTVTSRFLRQGGRKASSSDTYVVNDQWRPFVLDTPKSDRKKAQENNQALPLLSSYTMAPATVIQMMTICSSFYSFLNAEEVLERNPFKAIKQKSSIAELSVSSVSRGRSLTKLQWAVVIETAEQMAADDADGKEGHQRTLFVLVTIFALYLRISDLVGRGGNIPTMGNFKLVGENWWFSATGKGNKRRDISVRDEYLPYLIAYRNHLGLSDLPPPGDPTPLIQTLKGRGGLSDRHVRSLIQEVFDKALERMKQEGFEEYEIESLRSASLHWLRHTSATFDSAHRSTKDLQHDLGHSNQKTTEDIYFNSLDDERALSGRKSLMKDF